MKKTTLTFGLVSGLVANVFAGTASFVAHEWGTFTSVQGGDGVLLDWRPLESSELPAFVYDWNKPGLDRRAQGMNPFSKNVMVTLQRMETPVIYFYADAPQTVDVSVKFPQGWITEWYPQAAQIGPATTLRDDLKHTVSSESGAYWAGVAILPAIKSAAIAGFLPSDRSGNHYFAARDTDSAYLRIASLVPTNPAPEHEKFIFYRGAGNFGTPLKVTTGPANSVTITNTGSEPLADLFIMCLQNRAGRFVHVERLAPGQKRTLQVDLDLHATAVSALSQQLGQQMAKALTRQGLYPREASAMVNTWKDSWFGEEGLRVLYVLPRQWTDRTLPLKLTPKPRELVRVMVGRAEVLTPAREHPLILALVKSGEGDVEARGSVFAELKSLGRFAEPTLRLATAGMDKKTSEIAWQIFQRAAQPISPYE